MSSAFLSSEEYDERAHQLYDEGNFDEALAVLREGLALYPNAVELHVGVGYARLARDEFAWARQSFEEALVLDHDHEDGLAGLEHFLALSDRPSALVCFNDMMAIGVLKGLRQAGIQVPNEFSVTGFDNIVFSAFTNPPLTTFDQPKRFIGAEAARLVLELLDTPPVEGATESCTAATGTTTQPMVHPGSSMGKVQKLKGRLLIRETTAMPKAFSPRAWTGSTTRKS